VSPGPPGDWAYPVEVSHLLLVMGLGALTVVLVMAVVAVVARRTGRVAVVDVAWGLGFVAVALVSTATGELLRRGRTYRFAGLGDSDFRLVSQPAGDSATDWFHDLLFQQSLRSWLLVALVAVWGGRLAWHIMRRAKGQGEDPRYVELMARGSGGIARKVLVPQGLAMWFVSLPVQVAAVSLGPIGWQTWVGAAVWLGGLAFESVGDAQLAAYKKHPDRPPVMDRGLWRYTRHPNYFGDACAWWGVWLVAADVWPGALTILSPVAMTWFLVFATGARLLERSMMKRPGYPEYAARTSMFFPLPPKRRPAVS